MQNKLNDVRAVSDEQASTMVVLDEGSLDDVGGGCPPIPKPCPFPIIKPQPTPFIKPCKDEWVPSPGLPV